MKRLPYERLMVGEEAYGTLLRVPVEMINK